MKVEIKPLTETEIYVLRRVALGFSNKDIANDMKLSPKTIETHRNNIYKKLDLHNAVNLTHYALRFNLVDLKEFK